MFSPQVNGSESVPGDNADFALRYAFAAWALGMVIACSLWAPVAAWKGVLPWVSGVTVSSLI